MKITYDKVVNDIWDVIKDKTNFVYETSNDCDVCEAHNEWDYDPKGFVGEPPTCEAHYDGDACRYFYADIRGFSNHNTPACVVGNWFVYNEFTEEELNVSNWDQLEGQAVVSIVNKSHLEVDDDARDFLALIQSYQDTGMSWGLAFEKAVASGDPDTPNRWKVGQSET